MNPFKRAMVLVLCCVLLIPLLSGCQKKNEAPVSDPLADEYPVTVEGTQLAAMPERVVVLSDNIADVPIGGLGILMAKKSVDGLRYERVGDSNVVTIVKQW